MSRVLSFLSKHSGLSTSDVRSIIKRAPRSYKFFQIPKRTKGVREIAQPAREVKALQRLFVRGLDRLPIHESATAYRRGKSIVHNAELHASPSGIIKKYDFKDFFPNIRSADWEAYCDANTIFVDPIDIELSTDLLFHRPKRNSERLILAIGAPSSPWLSNVLMHDFDTAIAQRVKQDHIVYSRYADDLTFSAPRTGHLTRVDSALKAVLREIQSPRLRLNSAKTVTATTKYKRVVTGLVLTTEGSVSVGRERKRLIRAMLHHAATDRLDGEGIEKLRGLLAFALSVEPSYFTQAIARHQENLPESIRSLLSV
ncbi:MAG: retron St85 family RNA-directed DNA polymerase [Pseudomonadota bacterium]